MAKLSKSNEPLETFKCWHCDGQRNRGHCSHCESTGRLFYVGGYSFPYTPEGEKAAQKALTCREGDQ